MSTVEKAWSELVDGTGEAPSNPHVRKQIIARARREASQPDEAGRIQALKVLRTIGGLDALSTAIAFAEDPSLEVRQRLVRMAVDAADDGRPVLRRMVADPDVILACEVIDRLTTLKDRSISKRMRGLLQSKHARVRTRAAIFLGRLAGPSMVPFLARHQDQDPVVQSVVQWAIAAIDGTTTDPPPPDGDTWAGATATPSARKPTERAKSLPPPEPPTSTSEPALVPQPTDAALPAPRPAAAPSASPPRAPVESSSDAVLTLFCKLAAASEPAKADPIVAQLKAVDERSLSQAFRTRRPGKESAASIGAAKAAAALGNTRWLAPVKKLAADPDPMVRAAVATALGALCTPAAFGDLEKLARDPAPEVHLAALPALATAAVALSYQRQATRLLEELPKSTDEATVAARSAAVASLAGT